MDRQTIIPESEEHWLALRCQDLTSSDIAALFGLSPYKTHFELWHEKRAGERVEFKENERLTWGKRLEPAVAAGIAEDQGWAIRPMKEYMRLAGLRIGSSFDFRVVQGFTFATRNNMSYLVDDTADDAILEIKCVDWLMFRDGWTIDEGFIEAPAHIEIQVQHEMLVSGLRRAYIGVMVGGNDIRIIEREADDSVQRGILAAARAFWASIDSNTPPDPVMPDDAAAVIRLNQFAQPGKLVDARDDAELATLLLEYQRLGKIEKDAAEERKVVKADILVRIGDAEKVIASNGKVSAGIVGPSTYTVEREGYRMFRFTPSKTAAPVAEAAE